MFAEEVDLYVKFQISREIVSGICEISLLCHDCGSQLDDDVKILQFQMDVVRSQTKFTSVEVYLRTSSQHRINMYLLHSTRILFSTHKTTYKQQGE